MEWFKRNKYKVIIPLIIVLALTAAFFANPAKPKKQSGQGSYFHESSEIAETTEAPEETTGTSAVSSAEIEPSDSDNQNAVTTAAPVLTITAAELSDISALESADIYTETTSFSSESSPNYSSPSYIESSKTTAASQTQKQITQNESAATVTITTQSEQTTTEALNKCTVSISCASVLDNMGECDPAKRSVIPPDGWILRDTVYEFKDGETVFDVLKNVCRANNIHLEFTTSPLYNTAYIEGINNLYEFDVGELSGWEYCVNGWYPNYGCSGYTVKDGDVICWRYTCDRGADIGDNGFVG